MGRGVEVGGWVGEVGGDDHGELPGGWAGEMVLWVAGTQAATLAASCAAGRAGWETLRYGARPLRPSHTTPLQPTPLRAAALDPAAPHLAAKVARDVAGKERGHQTGQEERGGEHLEGRVGWQGWEGQGGVMWG